MSSHHPAPHHLTPEEISDPLQVIHFFFDYATLASHQQLCWQWLKATVSGTWPTNVLSKEERHSIIVLYEQLNRLIEAAHLIHRQQAKRRQPKKKTGSLSKA